jgi:hypothetical protein
VPLVKENQILICQAVVLRLAMQILIEHSKMMPWRPQPQIHILIQPDRPVCSLKISSLGGPSVVCTCRLEE